MISEAGGPRGESVEIDVADGSARVALGLLEELVELLLEDVLLALLGVERDLEFRIPFRVVLPQVPHRRFEILERLRVLGGRRIDHRPELGIDLEPRAAARTEELE